MEVEILLRGFGEAGEVLWLGGVLCTEGGWLRIVFFQAEDGIRDYKVTGVQTCALPIWLLRLREPVTVPVAEAVNRRLVRALRGDENAALLTQVLRVPGTFQFKDPARPFLCRDRKSTRLNSSHLVISYAVFCLKKKITYH